MSPPLEIDGVLCTHTPPGRDALLRRTLESLAEVRRPAEFRTLWVIENGSDQGARALCEELSPRFAGALRYVHRPQKGKALALQDAMDRIGQGFAVFLDDDTRTDPAFFEAYRDAALRWGENAVYGGELLIDYETPPPAWLIPELPPSARGWSWPNADEPVTKPLFLGANYAGFVQTIQRVGGFRGNLGVGSGGNPIGEETELQERMLAAGCRGVYVPGARVWHWVPAERCTPRWTLERCHRIWLTNGLMEKKELTGPRVGGIPRWMWRRRAALWANAKLAAFVRDEEKKFAMRKQYYQWRGYTEGVKRKLSEER
jgi:GT2 family glycosyltransferase